MLQTFDLQQEFTNPELEAQLLVAIQENPNIYFEVMDWAPPLVWTYYREDYEAIAHAIGTDAELPALNLDIEPTKQPEQVAKDLVDLYQRRESARLHQEQLQKLYQNEVPAKDLIVDTEKQLSTIQSNIKELQLGQMVSVSDVGVDLLTTLRDRYELVQENGSQAIGLRTGFRYLDRALGGLQEGIHLLAAEPGQGKSTMALQIARTVASTGTPAIFISFEEPLDRLALKCYCSLGGHNMKDYNEGRSNPDELLPTIEKYKDALANLHLIQGKKDLSVREVMARARQVMQKTGTEKCLIVVDYLQRWAAHMRDHSGDFRHTVRELAADIRESLALKLKSPVLVISSQNRSNQGEAKLTSLKESGDLEYDADTAMFLTNDPNTDKELVDLSLKKNRFGENDQKFSMKFKAEQGLFTEEGYK